MLPLHFRNEHLFLENDGAWWLFDTGAPISFGIQPEFVLEGVNFRLADTYFGLNADTLTGFVGVECAGLLGVDVLGQFDFLLDISSGTVDVSSGMLEHVGRPIPLDNFMGAPIVLPRIRGIDRRMFFDTGAQISYLQHDDLATFPPAGDVTDFYPGFGQFQTKTYDVETVLGDATFVLRCGTLPELLAATLTLANTEGIIGNQILRNQRTGYFPRRNLLVL